MEKIKCVCPGIVTQKGWEKLWRAAPGQDGNQIINTASFSGEYFMTWSSQAKGSARVGHKWQRFLNHPCSLKKLGIAVSGLELNQPLTVPSFLKSKKAAVKIVHVSDGRIEVRGTDPFAEGDQIALWLEPRFGYRPIKIEFTDKRGVFASLDVPEYRKLNGARGDFWFPFRGTWNCFDFENRIPSGQFRFEATEVHADQHPLREEL